MSTKPELIEETVPLAAAAPGSPLEDVRIGMLARASAEYEKRAKETTYDAMVEQYSIDDVHIYVRYRLPGVKDIASLQGAIMKDNRTGKRRNHMAYNAKFLYDLCEGMYVVSADDPDTELSLDISVPPGKATDPDTWPDFADGWPAIVKALNMDPSKVRSGYDVIEVLYRDGDAVSLIDKLAEVAGFRGN